MPSNQHRAPQVTTPIGSEEVASKVATHHPILEAVVETYTDGGDLLTETVRLELADFSKLSVQEASYLEDVLDPEMFNRLLESDVTPADFARSPKLTRAVLFAKVKAATVDRRIRAHMQIDDFDLDLEEMYNLIAAGEQ